MDRSLLQAFARRNRDIVAKSKRLYWAQQYQAHSAEHMLETGARLWMHARAVRPEFPTEREREIDLQAHVRLKQLLTQASHGITRR